jgi:hypothetical protein
MSENSGGELNIASGSTGSSVQNVYVRRTVTVLAVYDHEVEHLAFMNTLSTVCFSVGSGLFFFALGAWANGMFAETLTARGEAMMAVVVPGCLVLAVLSFVGGGVALSRRGSTLNRVRDQSAGDE